MRCWITSPFKTRANYDNLVCKGYLLKRTDHGPYSMSHIRQSTSEVCARSCEFTLWQMPERTLLAS